MRVRIALCKEVLRDMDFAAQCGHAVALGYDGIERAPFTLSDTPHLLRPAEIAATRQAAEDAGLVMAGLHWLLIRPEGLSRNRRGPGQGADRFAPVLRALHRGGYAGWIRVEPFDYVPDGPSSAARAIGYMRGVEDGLS